MGTFTIRVFEKSDPPVEGIIGVSKTSMTTCEETSNVTLTATGPAWIEWEHVEGPSNWTVSLAGVVIGAGNGYNITQNTVYEVYIDGFRPPTEDGGDVLNQIRFTLRDQDQGNILDSKTVYRYTTGSPCNTQVDEDEEVIPEASITSINTYNGNCSSSFTVSVSTLQSVWVEWTYLDDHDVVIYDSISSLYDVRGQYVLSSKEYTVEIQGVKSTANDGYYDPDDTFDPFGFPDGVGNGGFGFDFENPQDSNNQLGFRIDSIGASGEESSSPQIVKVVFTLLTEEGGDILDTITIGRVTSGSYC